MTEGEPMTPEERASVAIESVRLVVGMEIHVELATASKMFARVASPAAPVLAGNAAAEPAPNTLIDPIVLALPGSLPGLNRRAVELSILVGLALNCRIADETKWDRKSYTYPDLPKGYQISQYDLPLCYDGHVEVPPLGERGEFDPSGEITRVGIIRAHLEEDAGKLSHEAPGGVAIDGSLVDLNRAGTPLLEIVTQPDIRSAEQAVAFCRLLRTVCRFVGATEGVMQRGHMRFEPNINCVLMLEGGRTVTTPIVEVKNLNSFRAVAAAIEHELAEQPKRWRADGRVMGPGAKTTRGWDDAKGVTFTQREKEDAHDYRYFPDPDIPTLEVSRVWVGEIGATLPELPLARLRRWHDDLGLDPADGMTLVEERRDAELFDEAVNAAVQAGLARDRAGKAVSNVVLQHMARLANERSKQIGDQAEDGSGGGPVLISGLGLSAKQIASIAKLREDDAIQASNAGKLVERLADPAYADRDAEAVAEYEGWLIVRDEGAMAAWIDEVIAANPSIVEQIRGGKQQAAGRLIGEVMKKSGGSADAKAVREMLLERIGSD
ncbi:MAG: Asp-tRNA(Asn)/Glu-tRNA(Gln) amidotransferase subunit GatB [Phycisphaeraceae bacterium]|nr:MAG: Asp-tRNA(Asn)/Glu-tRNA(Gln) amidotransferase subunit GatB [Phycisphaeraceae bacterium]